MNKEKVLSLATLARIYISDEEAEKLSGEFDSILNYVGEIKSLKANKATEASEAIRNVMRQDDEPHASSLYTEKILEQAPAREGSYIKVKKIL